MKNWKLAALCALFFLVLVTPVLAQERVATITLGRDPEPPYCVQNPGGSVDIFWDIQHTTTPDYVYYKLEDPTRTLILEDQTYPGSTGLNINRTWTAPSGLLDGKYWIRVEYWSLESSNEANAEVTFYICTNMGNLCVWKYRDANCNGVLDSGDPVVPNWWIKIRTPNGDNISRQTDYEGKVCWYGVPIGEYTVYDYPGALPPAGWTPVGPSQYTITLTGSDVVTVTFLNTKYDDCFGACCLPTGQCVQVKESECAGVFYGLGSLCAGITCPQPGVCCDPSNGACFVVLQVGCQPPLIWHPEWTSCQPTNPCPQPPPLGACCDPQGNCTVTPQAGCVPPNIWHPEWISCVPNFCPPPVPTENSTWGHIKATYR